MEENKKLEIKNLIDSRFEEDKYELCRNIEQGYIYGEYSNNEHYLLTNILSIWDELYLEKNPVPIVEETVEEPLEEEVLE